MSENREETTTRQPRLIAHAVLVGLTPLIPLPFVDDLVKGHLLRRMVRSLAAAHGRVLTPAEVETLTEERGGGCLGGCLGQAALYVPKKIFRKTFFFLEWKRAADLTSRTYHQGYLIDYALSSPHIFGAKSAAELRDAIDAVCREAPIKPLETAVGAAFSGSKGAVRSGVELLTNALRRRGAGQKPERAEVAEAVASVEEQEERALEPLTRRLQGSIANIPDEHFRDLRARLDARLNVKEGQVMSDE